MSKITLNVNPYFSNFLSDRESDESTYSDDNCDYKDSQNSEKMPLGVLLQEADLVSPTEIEIALEDQKKCGLKLGEILAEKGWLKKQTADFFVLKWDIMVEKVRRGEAKYKLGECLKEAGLISNLQLKELLELQQEENVIFGKLISEKGFLKKSTVDLFVKHLCFYNQKSFDLQAEETLVSARKLIFLKNYDSAILELRNALKNHPHHAGLHALLTIVFTKTKQLSMAKVHLHKAQRTSPKDSLVIEAANLFRLHENTYTYHANSFAQKLVNNAQEIQENNQKLAQQKASFIQKATNNFKKFLTITI